MVERWCTAVSDHTFGGVRTASCERCRDALRAKGGRRNHHTIYGARLSVAHLEEIGVLKAAVVGDSASNRSWFVVFEGMAQQARRRIRFATIRTLRPRDAVSIMGQTT